ncbi:MAG: hypothetical protein FD161_2753 [Limisphaerales bacterium]|nr:MAG: hypothetical protein FD161_2753 [Limisphaerales bacterium]KAG0508251.1 MAG: hypothetical protein E1N63_2504 [Limisphaerales bacterium]TXT49566.1 MAG: hypothetical protein FD140_2892 [Limisphaerales bacterium]
MDLLRERAERAIEQPDAQTALIALAVEFKTEGMTEAEVMELYCEFLRKRQDDTDETKYDAIFEALTLVGGHCSSSCHIFGEHYDAGFVASLVKRGFHD